MAHQGQDGGLDGQYLIHTVYRFRDAFRDPDKALGLFKQVPFLNGGLFECLDREVSVGDLERNPDLKRLPREGRLARCHPDRRILRAPGNPLKVPTNFFRRREKVDLNAEYDTKGKTYEANGLIELFSRYKFTVEENTPVEEEVALDPELLAKSSKTCSPATTPTRARQRAKNLARSILRAKSSIIWSMRRWSPILSGLGSQPRRPKRKAEAKQRLEMAMPGEFDLTRHAARPHGAGAGRAEDIGRACATSCPSRRAEILSRRRDGYADRGHRRAEGAGPRLRLRAPS